MQRTYSLRNAADVYYQVDTYDIISPCPRWFCAGPFARRSIHAVRSKSGPGMLIRKWVIFRTQMKAWARAELDLKSDENHNKTHAGCEWDTLCHGKLKPKTAVKSRLSHHHHNTAIKMRNAPLSLCGNRAPSGDSVSYLCKNQIEVALKVRYLRCWWQAQ